MAKAPAFLKKGLSEKAEPKSEERKESKLSPTARAKTEVKEARLFKKGGSVKKRGC